MQIVAVPVVSQLWWRMCFATVFLLCATLCHCVGVATALNTLVATWPVLCQLPAKSFSHAVLTLDRHSNHRPPDEHHQHLY